MKFATASTAPFAPSQIPIDLANPASRSACVTIPAGFVKQYSQALGLSRSTCSAYPRMAGMLRRPIAKPPGPGRLLPKDAVAQRDPLVEDATLLPADPDGGHDVVGAVEGFRGVRRGSDLDGSARLLGLVANERCEQLEPLGIDVHQPQLVETDPLGATQSRGSKERRADTDPDENEFHGAEMALVRGRCMA